jgi:hypothetical protein
MSGMTRSPVVAGLALVAVLFPLAARAGPPAAASAAYGIYAEFRQDGNTVPFGPLAEIAGAAPPAYADRVAAARVQEVVPIVAGALPAPSLFVDAALFASHVASRGFGIDAISAEADSRGRDIQIALMLNPPPPANGRPPQPQPFLMLSARRIEATANSSLVVPDHTTVDAGASFDRLVANGSLLGNQKVEFSGEAAKNKILFQSPNVTITLNRQLLTGLISCGLVCTFTADRIETGAVDVVLSDADLFGRRVSGEIVLGRAAAR